MGSLVLYLDFLSILLYSGVEGLDIPSVELGDGRNHTMDFVQWFLSVDPYQELEKEEVVKKDMQPSSAGRGNQVYWADQEPEEENPDLPYGAFSNERNLLKLGQQRLGKVEQLTSSASRSSVGRGRLTEAELVTPSAINTSVGQLQQYIDTHRNLEVISPEAKLVEDQFQRIVFKLPNVIDKARDHIVRDIAQKNMLGYTIPAAFIFAAFVDCVADLVLEERFWWLAPFQPSFLALALWVWSYAAGFGGIFLFPDVFRGNDFSGDPNLDCSSEDFFSAIKGRGLELDLSSITDRRSRGDLLVTTANLKLDLSRSLACILSKTRDYREAQEVKTSLEEMLDLIPLHQELTVTGGGYGYGHGHGSDDLAKLDWGLEVLWQQLPQLVREVREAVMLRVATRNTLVILLGTFNVLGNIGAILVFALPKKRSLLSSLLKHGPASNPLPLAQQPIVLPSQHSTVPPSDPQLPPCPASSPQQPPGSPSKTQDPPGLASDPQLPPGRPSQTQDPPGPASDPQQPPGNMLPTLPPAGVCESVPRSSRLTPGQGFANPQQDKGIFSEIYQFIITLLTTGQFTNTLGLGKTLGILASNGWGYSGYAGYFYFLKDPEPGCGLVELEEVLMRYQELRSLEVLVSGGESNRQLVRDVVTQWKREVETAMHCLLSEDEGRLLEDTVNMWTYLAQHRIDISSEMGIIL